MEPLVDLAPFKLFSSSNDWRVLWPEISLGLWALALLVLDLFLPERRRACIGRLAIAGQVLLFGFLLANFKGGQSSHELLFAGMIEQSTLTELMRLYFLAAAILISYLGQVYLDKQQLPRMEFFHVVMVLSASMMLLVQSSHFVMLFVALETVTVGFYILVSYCRTSDYSLEGGLKYLILGGTSSAILLFGIVLLYGAAGSPGMAAASQDSMHFAELEAFIAAHPDSHLVRIGVLLVVCGLLFKVGAVPFQIWIPDVYQGAPTPVTAFLAVASKAAGLVVLMQLLNGPFQPLAEGMLIPLLSAVAAVTILFGNITALTQRNLKRMMGLSGIAHAGYLLLGLIACLKGVEWAQWVVVFYLFTYLLGSVAVFGVMAQVAGEDDENQDLAHYQNLADAQPFLSGVLAIGLGSLAGIPPLAGFIGKLLLFVAAFQVQLYFLLATAILGVVISIYYYFGWLREAYFKKLGTANDDGASVSAPIRLQNLRLGVAHRVALGAVASLTILLGVYQGFL